jgi:hypothetical protein
VRYALREARTPSTRGAVRSRAESDGAGSKILPIAGTWWWAEQDSNLRRRKPADLQSAPFGHFGIYPFTHSNEGLERYTGYPAGRKWISDGTFPRVTDRSVPKVSGGFRREALSRGRRVRSPS